MNTELLAERELRRTVRLVEKGSISSAARRLGISRTAVRKRLSRASERLGLVPGGRVASGRLEVLGSRVEPLPPPGRVRRYLLTSAQNNTWVHKPLWRNLLRLARHYDATIMVGRFTYNKAAYGSKAVKPGRGPTRHDKAELWYDKAINPYICDERVQLAPDLVWCGEMNILPTALRPLSGLETYSGLNSAVFPHAKVAMASVPQMAGQPVKFNYTTGTVTQRNYIQKKEGLRAEFHHSYGALLVEVDSAGDWFARQVVAGDDGSLQDLRVRVVDGVLEENAPVAAITWGDAHAEYLEPRVAELAWGDHGMLDQLRPEWQFLHDTLDFRARNHHERGNPHKLFLRFVTERDTVEEEIRRTRDFINNYAVRSWCKTVVVDSNHDNALERWLREADYRADPPNAIFFLRLQLAKYEALRDGEGSFHVYEHAMRMLGVDGKVCFLRPDESLVVAGIENGMHGHLGPNGRRGNPSDLSRLGRKANIGHMHSACIIDGLYVAGVSAKLNLEYNRGPSSWSHSHIVTYPSGKRTIITMRNGKWRAT